MGMNATELVRLARFDHRYGVTKCGDVYSFANKFGLRKAPLKLKAYINGGYCEVKLKIDGTKYHCKVHRLVAEAFLGLDPSSNQVVHHRNSVKNDNRIENLEICSISQNAKYSEAVNKERFSEQRKLVSNFEK